MNQYDPSLFKGTAWYYARYRMPYPKTVFDLLVEKFALDGTGRLLDLGAGTGEVAVPLSKYFEAVIAVEPDNEMINEGTQRAKKARITNIIWQQKQAEDFTDKPSSFRLATIGAALHWMDKDIVLKKVYNLLIPAGGLAVLFSKSIWRGEEEWHKAVIAVIKKYLGEERRAGKGTYSKDERRFEDIITQAGFSRLETHTVTEPVEWTIERLIGNLYSMSFASKEMLGDKSGKFEKELRNTLLKLNPAGTFTEKQPVEAMLAWK